MVSPSANSDTDWAQNPSDGWVIRRMPRSSSRASVAGSDPYPSVVNASRSAG